MDDGVEVIVDGTGWQLFLDEHKGWSGFSGWVDPETEMVVYGDEDHDEERRRLGRPDASLAHLVAALRASQRPVDADEAAASDDDALPLRRETTRRLGRRQGMTPRRYHAER
jgi:hypothetical protein